jgi:hypothetical protein
MAYDTDYSGGPPPGFDEAEAEFERAMDDLAKVAPGIAEKRRAEFRVNKARAETEGRRAFYDDVGSQFRDVPNDPATGERADKLFDLRAREIDKGEYRASGDIARDYSKRGMGGSGYATAARSQAAQSAAAERERARASALDQAVAEGQKGILGQANISAMGDPFLRQMLSSAEQQYSAALQQAAQQRAAFEDQMFKLAGYAVGGPIGGTAAGYGDADLAAMAPEAFSPGGSHEGWT